MVQYKAHDEENDPQLAFIQYIQAKEPWPWQGALGQAGVASGADSWV